MGRLESGDKIAQRRRVQNGLSLFWVASGVCPHPPPPASGAGREKNRHTGSQCPMRNRVDRGTVHLDTYSVPCLHGPAGLCRSDADLRGQARNTMEPARFCIGQLSGP